MGLTSLWTLALSATARSSSRCLRARVLPDHLRRLSEDAQEAAAHAVAIGETRLPSDARLLAQFWPHFPGGPTKSRAS